MKRIAIAITLIAVSTLPAFAQFPNNVTVNPHRPGQPVVRREGGNSEHLAHLWETDRSAYHLERARLRDAKRAASAEFNMYLSAVRSGNTARQSHKLNQRHQQNSYVASYNGHRDIWLKQQLYRMHMLRGAGYRPYVSRCHPGRYNTLPFGHPSSTHTYNFFYQNDRPSPGCGH